MPIEWWALTKTATPQAAPTFSATAISAASNSSGVRAATSIESS